MPFGISTSVLILLLAFPFIFHWTVLQAAKPYQGISFPYQHPYLLKGCGSYFISDPSILIK